MARKRDSLVPINQQSEQPMLSRIGPVREGKQSPTNINH